MDNFEIIIFIFFILVGMFIGGFIGQDYSFTEQETSCPICECECECTHTECKICEEDKSERELSYEKYDIEANTTRCIESGYCPECDECEKCEVCEQIVCPECSIFDIDNENYMNGGHWSCGMCEDAFEKDLFRCEEMLARSEIQKDGFKLLYKKFQQLDTVISLTEGSWKYKNTKDEDRYVCLDYTKEFEKKWNELGYDGKLIIGSTPKTRQLEKKAHAWYAVYIDIRTGEFIKIIDGYREELDFYDQINSY